MINEQITAQLNSKPITARRIHARLPDGVVSLATVARVLDHLVSLGEAVKRKQGDHWFYAKDYDAFGPFVMLPKRHATQIKRRRTISPRAIYFAPILAILDAKPWCRLRDIVDADFVGTDEQRLKKSEVTSVRLARMLEAGAISRYKDGKSHRYARRGTLVPCGWRGVAA